MKYSFKYIRVLINSEIECIQYHTGRHIEYGLGDFQERELGDLSCRTLTANVFW